MDWEPNSHTSSFGGNPLALVASLAVIDIVRSEHLLENSVRMGHHLLRRLRELAEKYPIIGDVRGKGLLVGFEVVKGSNQEPGIIEAQDSEKKL